MKIFSALHLYHRALDATPDKVSFRSSCRLVAAVGCCGAGLGALTRAFLRSLSVPATLATHARRGGDGAIRTLCALLCRLLVVVTLALLSSSVVTSPGGDEIIEPVVQRRVGRRNPGVSLSFSTGVLLSPWRSCSARCRARTMVSGAKGGRWPHDPQRSGLAREIDSRRDHGAGVAALGAADGP